MGISNHKFNILGLDKDFEVLQVFNFINVQWSRKFFAAGQFSIQIPLKDYNKEVKYVYSSERPEVGEITQVNYVDTGTLKSVYLSGYFIEHWMNHRVVYAKGKYTNITSDPGWIVQEGKSEDVARAYFNAFKDISYTFNGQSYTSIMGVDIVEESQHRGNTSVRHRLNDYLGNKMYSILKPSDMSPRFNIDFVSKVIQLNIIQGRDLTQDNTDNNNPVIFSTVYGNLKKPNIVMSSTNYKNCFVVSQQVTNTVDQEEEVYTYAGNEAKETDTKDIYLSIETGLNKEDFSTNEQFIEALLEEGHSGLLEFKRTLSTTFELIEGSYDYLTDFDLGDICSIEVPEIELSGEAVLSTCYEVMKKEGWSMSMDFTIL